MSTKSQELGESVNRGIDSLEAGIHESVHSGAQSARDATSRGANWAASQETLAARKARALKQQATEVGKSVSESIEMVGNKALQIATASDNYVKRKPWTAIAITAGVSVLAGAIWSARRREI